MRKGTIAAFRCRKWIAERGLRGNVAVIRLLILQVIIPTLVAGAPFWFTQKCRVDQIWGGVGQILINGFYKWGMGLPRSCDRWLMVLEGKIPPIQWVCVRDTVKVYNRLVDSRSRIIRYALDTQCNLMASGIDCWLKQFRDMVLQIIPEEVALIERLATVNVDGILRRLWNQWCEKVTGDDLRYLNPDCSNRRVIQYASLMVERGGLSSMDPESNGLRKTGCDLHSVGDLQKRMLIARFRHLVTPARIHDYQLHFQDRICRFCQGVIECESHWLIDCVGLNGFRQQFPGVNFDSYYQFMMHNDQELIGDCLLKLIKVVKGDDEIVNDNDGGQEESGECDDEWEGLEQWDRMGGCLDEDMRLEQFLIADGLNVDDPQYADDNVDELLEEMIGWFDGDMLDIVD